ncbi:MAG: PAS domain-containing protein [Alphaproteobacteria bacterium]|nr:PAS domain-containing protein [Alphaproteobacteria bacterium]MBU1513149.1 PAS domain-containing protein [Alphaproteobacteria bacterium]MBU2095257.1 PAS domain-containing protein [Alphaproteobacteria bacterium]MBU2152172.1 PAS domain-containing protein [Alphaproteobacteria bacterium]MBU2306781.1 PAS domain-containing protein [Alphaproteobacteria bacterium]
MSEELRTENARLAARVAELEAQLEAKPAIDRVSLFRMTNNAPWGVIALNGEGGVDYANPAFQRWLTKPAPAIGERQADALAPALFTILEACLPAALAGQAHEAELRLRDASGETRDVRLHVVPRGGGKVPISGAIVSLYDITETQALDRSVRENEARLSHINTVAPTANYIFDFEAGVPAWVAGRTERVYGYSADELLAGGGDLIRSLIHPDDFAKVGQRLAQLTAAPDGDVREFELRVRHRDGGYRWVLDRAVAFERNAQGRVVKTLSAALDIDERKRAEERRTLLINELNHRVKNTLASVQSIARQTLRSARTPDEMADVFTGRLIALASAHDVLTRENWEGAGLTKIVEVALAPFDERRIARSGPDVRLDARAALALGMALHELATNASKYGALSNETGAVRLAWRVREDDALPTLELEWRESGGPPVVAPKRRGFGSRLLTQGVRSELNGAATLDFAPDGLVCRITASLEPTPLLELSQAPSPAS